MPFSIKEVDVWFLHCCPSLASTSPLSFRSSFLSLSLTPSFFQLKRIWKMEDKTWISSPLLLRFMGHFKCASLFHSLDHTGTVINTLHPKEEIRRLQQSLHFLQRQPCDKHCEIIDGESKLSCDHATINTQHIFGKYHGTKMNRRCQASNYVCSFIQ